RAVLLPALRHRVQLNFEGSAENVSLEDLMGKLFEQSVRAVA
ncbi:MAG: hypothetical protein K0R85_2340, partial [Devosia sp.]|nr:hypothetical protein [Devosia sp.]